MLAIALAAVACDAAARPAAAMAEIPTIASRQRAEKKSFTDSEIIDGFFKVTRKGEDLWVFVFLTGGRPKWGQEGMLNPALYTVVVSSKWTVSKVMQGWQQ